MALDEEAPEAAAWRQRAMTDKAPLRWLFAGDSITHGALHTEGWRDYVQLFEERLRWELGRSRDTVIRTAFSGQTSVGLLEDFGHAALDWNPDVVSIMIGMNDAGRFPDGTTERNLRTMLGQLAALPRPPFVVLHTTNPILPGFDPGREPQLPGINDGIRAAAAGAVLVDHARHWEALFEAVPLRRVTYMSDGIHPNAHGHRAFARLFMKRLGLWDDATRCMGEVLP